MKALATIAVVVSALLAAGCEDRLPTLSTAQTAIPLVSPSAPIGPGEVWNITATINSITGPVVCWAPRTDIGTTAHTPTMAITRATDSIRLTVGYGWYDPDTYVGTVVGSDFKALGPSYSGYNVCGTTQHHWRIEQHVSGRFSSNGRSLTATEVWLYKLPDGDEVAYYIDWTAARSD